MADHPPIFGEARFTRDARAIRIEIEFDTLNFCAYEIVARDAHSNTPVLHETGDNETAQDDIYMLPGAPMLMDGRRVLLYVDIMDQTGDLGRYAIALRFFQGDVVLRWRQGHDRRHGCHRVGRLWHGIRRRHVMGRPLWRMARAG